MDPIKANARLAIHGAESLNRHRQAWPGRPDVADDVEEFASAASPHTSMNRRPERSARRSAQMD